MKSIVLRIEDSLFDNVLNFLKLLPKEKVKIISEPIIPFVDEKEQQELEEILKDKECFEIAYEESVEI